MRLGWWVAGLAAFACSAAPVHAVEWRLLSESADGLVLRLEVRVPPPERIEVRLEGRNFSRFYVPDARSTGEPGTPELLVCTQLVAVPPGGTASLRVLAVDTDDLGDVALAPRPLQRVAYGPGASPDDPSSGFPEELLLYDPEAYVAAGRRTEAASLGAPGALRHLQVVALEVWPLLYDPVTTRLHVVRRLEVELRLQPGGSGRNAREQVAAELATPTPWRQIYDALVLNTRSARGWLRAAQPERQLEKPLASGMLRPGLLNEDEWKLRVGATGPLRVPATVLLGQGFPDGTPVERLRLVLKRFEPASPLVPNIVEIPLLVEDDGDGLFRSGDSFVFYAEHPRDDSTAGERAARYSTTNVYWLSIVESGTPPRLPVRAPVPGALPGPTRFAQDITYEDDRALNYWVYGDDEELYFLLDLARPGQEATYAAAVPGRAADSDLEICVDTQQDWLQRPFNVEARLQSGRRLPLGSHPGLPPPPFTPPTRIVVCGTIPAADVEPGDVTVIVTPGPFPDGFEDKSPYVDNVRLRYAAEYRAVNERVRCTSGGAVGPTAFQISGFGTAALLALDISAPKAPATFDLTGAVSAGVLTLTDDVPPGSTRRYLVLPRASVPSLPAGAVQRDTPDPILDELRDGMPAYDVLVVAHDDFAADAKLLEWSAFRQTQGHRVRIVRTSDVYDAFNGGLLHYEPIYQLVRAAYASWGLAYVLLVGDGSEDAAGVLSTSGPNLVPAPVRYFPVQASSGGGLEYRNDLYERYYVKMGTDPYPDLLIGRWPVSTTQELGNVVDKTLRYEDPANDDDGRWRKRVLVFSDDEWVRRQVPGGIVHLRGCAEWNFFFSIRRTCETVNGAFPGDLRCVPFYLHEYTNALWSFGNGIPEHAAWPIDSLAAACFDTLNYVRPHTGSQEFIYYDGPVARALVDSVGEGVLFFALQSHANRAVVTDEGLIRRRPVDPAAPFVPDFRNHGKPFVFFGLGCHLNEFGIPGEEAGLVGDALGELYLTVPERGAVASYASTGFEYLQANNRFHENMWRTIFEKRYFRSLGNMPINPDTVAANWLLSALLQVSEISNFDLDIIDRYALFGDPLLQIDAGVPRFRLLALENGFLFPDGRLVSDDPSQPVRFSLAVSDEQGIHTPTVEKRFNDGRRDPVAGVRVTATVDTAAQIVAKRGYQVDFELFFDTCDFELVVSALDLAGRLSEFSARVAPDEQLLANGLVVGDGSVVDSRAAFRYVLEDCVPDSSLDLAVFLDGAPLETTLHPDERYVTWFADFAWNAAPGAHTLRIERDASEVLKLELLVGGALGLRDVIAFPNPFADKTQFFFNLDAEITGGRVRIMDLNGRTVRTFDLRSPGVLQAALSQPPPSGGTTMAMNFVEWDGTDQVGERVANGVYFYEVRVADASGHEVRRLEKIVVMR